MTTYSGLETSTHGGRPVELYRFAHGAQIWTYSSGPEIAYNGETYAAFPIGREDMQQVKELNKSSLEVLVPRTSELSLLYLAGNPEHVVTLTVFRTHVGASDGPVVYWKGRIVTVDWPDNATAKLSCESVFTSLKRPGLRARYQRMCRHALYSGQCGVDKDTFAVAGTVSAINAAKTVLTVTAADALDDGWFTGGMVETPTGGFLFVTAHTGSSITLANPCALVATNAVTLYPGCARNRETCKDKFNNILNFGGWPWIPTRNPFDGRSLV
jgi:uncharacterized phage protein (TIGR02218 family)